MTKIMPIDPPIPRGGTVRQVGDPPLSEAGHFFKCPFRGYFDASD
jgi:hypothetical protein